VTADSQQVLSTQVNLAKIKSIEIFSRTRQVNSGDHQHLQVKAYDDQGNVFSSLQGLRFNWEVQAGQQFLRRVNPRDSQHNFKDLSLQEEKAWTLSDQFFFKALSKGYASLSVQILERGYEHVPTAALSNLTIVDPFVIQPATPASPFDFLEQHSETGIQDDGVLRLPPNSHFNFKLALLKKEAHSLVTEEVPRLESARIYSWTISDSSLARINQDGTFESKVKIGVRSEISVREKQFPNNTDSLEVLIAEPFSLRHLVSDITPFFSAEKLS